jgi:hypothetical protein
MLRVTLWALVLAGVCTAARADVIGVNFSSGVVNSVNYNLGASTVAGVAGTAEANWNNLVDPNTSLSNLKNKFGATTTAGVSFSYSGTGGYTQFQSASLNSSPGNNTMYGSCIRATNGGTLTVSLTNIPYAVYDVYVYASQNDTATNTLYVTDGTTTYYYKSNGSTMNGTQGLTRVTSTNSASPTAGMANYSVFSGETGSSFSFTLGPGVAGVLSNNLYGFQIVNAAVPEPGTLLLGGIAAACGGGGVWWTRRKRPAAQPALTEAESEVGAD